MSIYTHAIRPLLFRMEPERAHDRAIRAAALASRSKVACAAASLLAPPAEALLAVDVCAMHLAHPVGLAAGFDKSGRGIPFWGALGFSHVEIGSISAHPSRGNPKPRLFRIPDDEGIVVNYGLPNDGAVRVAERLATLRMPVPLGINIVNTNKGAGVPPDSDAEIIGDYVESVRRLESHAAYLTLNLSCPNTCDGRTFFAHPQNLARLLEAVGELGPRKPVFLKVAPFAQLDDLEGFLEHASKAPYLRGFEVNLPPGKPVPLRTPDARLAMMPGAVSGKPCEDLINGTLRALYQRMDRSKYCLVAAGGIFTGADAYRKIRLGASLVQLLTALVYQGPLVVRNVVRELTALLTRDGYHHVSDAVGTDAR
ncbi:MAG: quinone-dependent dihydroorotate dehydrogenase [Bryobacterales bacterium]|nr:quinone-dependent dihydroorotate dehydrogenase [Bryobacterales bacterium]